MGDESFKTKLGDDALAHFNKVAEGTFSEQAVAFLNAYWGEVASQAEFIFSVAYEMMKKADMDAKGISLVHLYEEGVEVDFDIGLRFYEILTKFVEDNTEYQDEVYEPSQPEMMTALKRKQEFRSKVDVNFNGKVSFLEYLLYQYQNVANPADFVVRSQEASKVTEHEDIIKARAALEEATAAIRAYEEKKHELEEGAKLGGVKGMKFKNELAQLESSPLMEHLMKALITAEAAVRMATKKHGGAAGAPADGRRKSSAADFNTGSMFWMNRDLEEKQRKYGKQKK